MGAVFDSANPEESDAPPGRVKVSIVDIRAKQWVRCVKPRRCQEWTRPPARFRARLRGELYAIGRKHGGGNAVDRLASAYVSFIGETSVGN
jgi:hypothetical protein